jgi:radical SAM superfamily enzyme YgiQ (UPF0313 family)
VWLLQHKKETRSGLGGFNDGDGYAVPSQGGYRRIRPEVIGIAVRNIDDQRMENPRLLLGPVKEIVMVCKGLTDAPVILGGAGYSIYPVEVLSSLGVDMGIQGEGEGVFPTLIDRIEQGMDLSRVPGLYLLGQGLQGKRVF